MNPRHLMTYVLGSDRGDDAQWIRAAQHARQSRDHNELLPADDGPIVSGMANPMMLPTDIEGLAVWAHENGFERIDPTIGQTPRWCRLHVCPRS